jgi:broad specificity phosphatase PhoE
VKAENLWEVFCLFILSKSSWPCYLLVMVEILFFRHGETDWNVRRIFQGHTDIPLNATGVQQAQALADKVRHWEPDVILCSDLTRAFHTAEYSQMQWRVPLFKTPLLREMNLGDAEGLHRDDVMKLVGPEGWLRWQSHLEEDEDFRFPHGESKAEARARMFEYLEKFIRENPDFKKIAVSTHGGVLKRVTHGLKGVPIGGVEIPNCVTYRMNYDGRKWYFIPVRERASALVVAQDKILTFLAIDPHSGQEYYFLPGGKIELNETVQECVVRETLEETGYEVGAHKPVILSEYDFTWNGTDVWCRTHFVRADLKSDFDKPRLVQDADYNKGVKWILATEFASYFSYNESICQSVRKLL